MSAASLQRALRKALKAAGDPERAAGQQAYMKSTMPYAGVKTPDMRRLAKRLCRDFPCQDPEDWEATILKIWREAKVREERYAASEILSFKPYRDAWLTPGRLSLLRELIETGAWWDYVDGIAINSLGALLTTHQDEMTPIMYDWAVDESVWIRRSAILAQLKYKERTDEALLFFAIEHSWSDADFFARKAIGWALREYSKTRPEVVADYVAKHHDHLSALSIREGLRVLKKQGLVD